MDDRYIDGVTKSNLDAQISASLSDTEDHELGGHEMTVAIQNESGAVYRVITVEGLSAYLHVTQSLLKLNLTDLYADVLYPGKFDSLFVTN